MTTPIDLILLPLHPHNEGDFLEIPGLSATQAVGRVARGRSLERLVMHFSLGGNAPISSKGYQKLMKHLGDMYYKTAGSSTSAMKTVAEWLNSYLFDRNKRYAERALKSTGFLTMVVFRAGRFYMAQCGEVHAFLMNSAGVTHFTDPVQVGRGLGYTKRVPIHYNQVGLEPEDLLLISPNPPPTWTADLLSNLRGIPIEEIHHRLIDGIDPEHEAVLISTAGGTGQLKVLRPVISVEGRIEVGLETEEAAIPGKKKRFSWRGRHQKSQPRRKEISPQRAAPPEPEPEDHTPEPVVIEQSVHIPPIDKPTTVTVENVVEDAPEQQVVESPKTPILDPALIRIGQAFGAAGKQGLRFISTLIRRMLPDAGLLSIPKNIMAAIAIGIPILVVGVAAGMYFQRGQGELYEEHYLQAEYAAEQAIQLTDAVSLRQSWNEVFDHLDQAEAYKVTEDSQALRRYGQSELDNLDSITRLPFQSALMEGLPDEVVIKKIVTADEDNVLYLLNETDGNVLRAIRSGQGYMFDPDFICEPVHQPLIVGALVDIIPLPPGNDANAEIMGMDANGNLMECVPGGLPPLTSQMPPPDMHWGKPTAFEMNSIGLFVLDPITNAVWIFWTNDGFSELPTLYFDEQVPTMGDVIDLTINRQDLFMLHADGSLTTCVFGYPTRCEDPAEIKDIQSDRQINEVIEKIEFREIQFAPPPDPSIYLLDPDTLSIYHLSVRLTYQRQYRPQTEIVGGQATAFTISSKHQVFLAVGNQVYYSSLP